MLKNKGYMELSKIEQLAQKYLNKCIEVYGYSKHQETTPYLEFETSIYARLSGDEEMEGEQTPDGEYDSLSNSIVIYYPAIQSERHLAETIVHEYQHYLQSPIWMTRYYNMGFSYYDHLYEIAATKEEKNWELLVS